MVGTLSNVQGHSGTYLVQASPNETQSFYRAKWSIVQHPSLILALISVD